MSSPQIRECPLNPIKYDESNYQTKTTGTIFAALMAIVAVSGFLIILSSQGVDLGGLNSLANIGVTGGAILTGIGGIPLLIILAWMITTVKLDYAKTKEMEEEPVEIDSSRLGEVFNEDQTDFTTKGSTPFKLVRLGSSASGSDTTHILHFKEETTFNDISNKLATILETSSSKLRFIFGGKEINKSDVLSKIGLSMDSPWSDICNHFNINYSKLKGLTPVHVMIQST